MTLRWHEQAMLMALGKCQRQIVAIDVDSVLFPVNEIAILPALSKALGRTVEKREITDWVYDKALGSGASKVAFEVFRRPDLYDRYSPSLMAARALRVLRAQHRVIAVSSPFAEHASSKWAFCRRAGFEHRDIYLCGDKSLILFDVLLDDRAFTCEELGAHRAIVFDQPWNRDLHPTFTRAYGWDDVTRKVARVLER